MEMNKHRAGLALGGLLGLWHLVWALLVAVGVAQAILDFVFRIHLLSNPYTVQPFRLGSAAVLIIVTALIGYVLGWVFAFMWNRFHSVKTM